MKLYASSARIVKAASTLALLGITCFSVRSASSGQSQAAGQPLPVTASAAKAWERVVDGSYENKGIAQIEMLNDHWVLNVMCDGTHTTYLDDTKIELTPHVGGFVQARYHYVERTVEVRCTQAPCPPMSQQFIALEGLTSVAATADMAREQSEHCNEAK